MGREPPVNHSAVWTKFAFKMWLRNSLGRKDMSSNHVEAFFVLLFSVLFCFVSVLFIVRTHRSRDATTIVKKYNSRFEDQCYQIDIRKNYMVWLSFELPNAKSCSKLRTVKTADHDCLLTVAYNLKTCRTMKLASD